jgi:transcriptional regulator GlxA family with amidase domain
MADILDLRRECTPTAVARRLSEVESLWSERLLARVLPRALSARARALIDSVADVAIRGGHVPELASALGIKERSVPRWCRSAGVPNARRLFSWIRLLLAAELLDGSDRSIQSVARNSGYSSAGSLKHATKQFLQLTPSELRDCGAFATVKEAFGREIHESREALRQSKHYIRSLFR